MTRFLKLSNIIINTSYIISIKKSLTTNGKIYYIYVNKESSPVGLFAFGMGFIFDLLKDNRHIDICEKLDPEDYKKVSEYIENINDVNNNK
jgi:hypothetical protein